VTDLHSV